MLVEPYPELCWSKCLLMDLVSPIYDVLLSLQDTNIYTNPVLQSGIETS